MTYHLIYPGNQRCLFFISEEVTDGSLRFYYCSCVSFHLLNFHTNFKAFCKSAVSAKVVAGRVIAQNGISFANKLMQQMVPHTSLKECSAARANQSLVVSESWLQNFHYNVLLTYVLYQVFYCKLCKTALAQQFAWKTLPK